MKINRVERAMLHNPVRSLMQWHYEAPLLVRLGGRTEGERVLEIGCGRGVGTQIIFERFGAGHVSAFDVDAEMVGQARRRLAAYMPDRLALSVGDAAAIQAEDGAFDAVFDFGVIHHVPDWRAAVAEVRRVLRPGGRFFFEEVTRQALNRWFYRTFLDHPTADRFSGEEFIAELERQGLVIAGTVVYWRWGDFVTGVAQRYLSQTRRDG